MAKAAKKKKGRPASPKKENPNPAIDLIAIETAPPPQWLRVPSPEQVAVLKKIDEVVPKVKVGQAFIIPAKNRALIKKHLATNFPTERFAFHLVNGNDSVLRVYKNEYKKPKS